MEDIIKLSKLDEESVELEKEDVELYELTREIVSRLSPQCSEKKISVALSGEPVFCHGIRQILDEMIYNITENAIKYNRDGGSVSVWVGNTLDGPKISVSDTGIGIPEEHQERIFERFYRVDKSHSKERGGTGLGLSIVKHGAILHGAKVTVSSEPGKGTKIEIRFPKEKKNEKGRSSLTGFCLFSLHLMETGDCASIDITQQRKGSGMILEIDFNSDEAIYIQLCNQIIMGIATSVIHEGDSLPSVRQLADTVGVNMHTVNKAYNVLKREGYISLDKRRGAVIALDVDKLEQLEEMRRQLRIVLARGCCKNISRSEVHELVDEIFDDYE